MRIPVANLRPAVESTREEWTANVDRMIRNSHYILGEQVASFEREAAAAFGAKFAVGVASGTDAINLSLRDLGARGQVLTSALTAPFSGIGILSAGCTPAFADVDPKTLQIDPEDAGNRIRKKTAAVLPVHLYGQPCEIGKIRKLGVPVVQDACQAHGARAAGKPLANWSKYAAFSFYPTKNLGCLGDGGMIVTNDAGVNKRLRELRDGGRRGGQISYSPGINSRLDEMHACYLRAFLPHLDAWNEDRRKTAAMYDQLLAGCPGVELVERTAESVCHLYVIRARRRDRLREYLAKHGIGSGIHYPVPLHLHPAFAGCGLKRGDLPHAEKACKEVLSLPLWPTISETEVEEVAARVREFALGKGS